MPWHIGWIDEDLHVYDSTVSDPLPPDEVEAFYDAWFDLVENGPAPLFALFDFSKMQKPLRSPLMSDVRFIQMGRFRDKIDVIAGVASSSWMRNIATSGARILRRADWFVFHDTREQAIEFLIKRARERLGKPGSAAPPPAAEKPASAEGKPAAAQPAPEEKPAAPDAPPAGAKSPPGSPPEK
ncbi:MAG: hypothetical protein Kow00124_26080 [Anaerolineae bacterium]